MHSWRALILPHFDLDALYKMLQLQQPWDGPNNKTTIGHSLSQCMSARATPLSARQALPQTSYVAVVGPNAAWEGEKSRKLSDFGNDASHTIMLVEVTNSGIAWAEPRDLSLDTLVAANGKSPALALTSNHGRREEFFFTYDYDSGVNVAMADGSVRFLRTGNRSPEDLRSSCKSVALRKKQIGEPERHLNWPNIAALAVWLLSVGTLLNRALRSRKPQVVPLTPPAH